MKTLALLAAVAMLGLTAACATGGVPAAAPSANAFNDCLRQEGIELPDLPADRASARPSGGPNARPSGGSSARPGGGASARPGGGASARPGGGASARPGGGQGMQPPAGVDAEKWQQALEKCGSLRPSAGPGGGDGRAAAYQNCLSERGVTLVPGQELSTTDPKTAEAVKACEVLRPSPQ